MFFDSLDEDSRDNSYNDTRNSSRKQKRNDVIGYHRSLHNYRSGNYLTDVVHNRTYHADANAREKVYF